MTKNLTTTYEALGGAPGIKQLVQRFYVLMDTQPESYEVRRMHPESLKLSEEKLSDFLSGWFGGPALYIEKNGHPRLRMRHTSYSIGPRVRDQWMLCMKQALTEQLQDTEFLTMLINQFSQMADHMINVEPRRSCGVHAEISAQTTAL